MTSPQRPVFNDRYEIHARTGRGGTADVFLARDRLLDRPVTVKVLFPEYAADPSFVERFRREARTAANLNHPNVVGVYDWGRQGSTYFIVMEHVKGETLAAELRNAGPVSTTRAIHVADGVAAALSAVHRNGVVHRNVKPGNIECASDGGVKLANFGIALNSTSDPDHPQARSVQGTAAYFSPEQAQGADPDPRSDLYSLGVVMYELVSGRTPFQGDNPVATAYRHVHEKPQALSAVRPGVPRGYEAIVMKLLAKSPMDRYATAEDVRADLIRSNANAAVREPFVFISYSREDASYVDLLVAHLHERGIGCWIDRTSEHGGRWAEEIASRIAQCGAFVLVMTPSSAASEWVEREVIHATQLAKPILPLLLDGTHHFMVLNRQAVDVSGTRLPPVEWLVSLRGHLSAKPV